MKKMCSSMLKLGFVAHWHCVKDAHVSSSVSMCSKCVLVKVKLHCSLIFSIISTFSWDINLKSSTLQVLSTIIFVGLLGSPSIIILFMLTLTLKKNSFVYVIGD